MKKHFSIRYRCGVVCLVLLLISISLTVGGCDTKGDEPEQEGMPVAEASEEKQEQKIGPVTVTRTIYGTDIEITAYPIQVKDGIAVLDLEYKLIGEIDPLHGNSVALYSILATDAMSIVPQNMRLIDFESKVVYQALQRADAPVLAGGFALVHEDDKFPVTALTKEDPVAKSVTLFPAPPIENITVFVPNFGLISNVPVVQADSDYDFESCIEAAGEPYRDTIEQQKCAFKEFLEDYSEEIAIEKTGTEFTVTISSDVLFDTDKYELNSEANVAIDKAVEKTKTSYDDGTIRIVGHTDDVDTNEYNQTLSEKRAVAVADVMKQKLGANFTFETLGKGETEPIAEGTTDEARAANRRVEIIFKGKTEEEKSTGTVTNTEIPSTEMSTGSGDEWVVFTADPGDYETICRVKALKIIRAEGVLIGYFALGTVGYGNKMQSASLMGAITDYHANSHWKRGHTTFKILSGAHAMSLLTPEGRLFPYDYARVGEDLYGEEDKWSRLLGDDRIYNVSTSDKGEVPTLLVTVIWPDTGQDKVTVDVKNRFRIENIEVDNNPEAINEKY